MKEELVIKTMDLLRKIHPKFSETQKTKFMRGLNKVRKEKRILKIEVKPEDIFSLKQPIEYNFFVDEKKFKRTCKKLIDEVFLKAVNIHFLIPEKQKEEIFNTLMTGIDFDKMTKENPQKIFKIIIRNIKKL